MSHFCQNFCCTAVCCVTAAFMSKLDSTKIFYKKWIWIVWKNLYVKNPALSFNYWCNAPLHIYQKTFSLFFHFQQTRTLIQFHQINNLIELTWSWEQPIHMSITQFVKQKEDRWSTLLFIAFITMRCSISFIIEINRPSCPIINANVSSNNNHVSDLLFDWIRCCALDK